MNKVTIINRHEGQFQYLDRWVDKKHFCAFVYNHQGQQLLAKSYEEYEKATQSGLWFAKKPESFSRKGKHKNGISSPDSQ